jgi:WxcM-like, C-terminal
MQSDEPLIKGCRWIDAPVDDAGNAIETWDIAEKLGFESPRIFYLTNVAEGQWRGRHAHRVSILATFAVNGGCRLTLDDGKQKQIVRLSERGPGLVIEPWIWHDLYDFAPGTVIMVVASTRYFEEDYIRDYDMFISEVAGR